ncbi:hypothetical protein BJV78DRAFT_1182705 [Lactifluus subvellereus]|nr:hypothetical protein BJV78DRAFT_1182705 [Lactifluus subvellereus]
MMTALRGKLCHPHEEIDPELARSRSECREKWRHSCEHSTCLCEDAVGNADRLYRPPPSPVPPVVRDEVVSPTPSRKRCRSVCLEQSDDEEESDGDSRGRLRASEVPETRKDQLSVSTDSDDVDMSDSDSLRASAEKEQRVSSRTSHKSSGKHKAGKCLEEGFEREYFSPSGVKLEVIELPVKYDTREWLKHVEQCPDGSRAPWRCTWQTMKNGSPVSCDYSSKKHLVKRHIEATHLCIKRFQCTWCQKTFTQRSNVAGCHLNTQ